MCDYSYSTGHPWYYIRNGKVLSLKEILKEVVDTDSKGYLEDKINSVNGNSAKLQGIKAEVLKDLKRDISRYRQCALELHRYQKTNQHNQKPICKDIHTAISLKRNHIFNEFANLKHIEEKLSHQPTLFDFE